jgi:hypothetical protein
LASDVGRQKYRYSCRSLCFELVAFVVVACALETDPFVVESAYSKHHRQPLVARAVEDLLAGVYRVGLYNQSEAADYSRAFEACLVRAALPSVHSGSLARLQEVGKILLGLEADYSRAFEADYSLSAFVVAYFDLYKLGQGLQIQAFYPAASEADYSRAFEECLPFAQFVDLCFP